METLQAILEGRLRLACSATPDFLPKVTIATDPRFGDYQTNAAMILAKMERANPRKIAQQIIDKLDLAEMCEPPEIAGAGFINFRLKNSWLAKHFADVANDEKLGLPSPAQPQKIVIDFSSPNVAKPMHVGHIRSTILGDAIARIASFIGHEVVRDNHIGDWGAQFGMLLVGWKTLLNKEALASDPLGEMERIYKTIQANIRAETLATVRTRFPNEYEQLAGTDLDEDKILARILESKVITFDLSATASASRKELVKLQNGDEENLALWREMIRLSQVQFDSIYSRLGIRFDVTLGESYYNLWLKDVVADLREKGIAQESEEAVCVFSDGSLPQKDDPFFIYRDGEWIPAPAIVQKSDGAANYTTTDLATLEYRLKTWSPDEIIYVTDGRQQLHFRQLFAIFRRWHPEVKARLAHVWFGSILGDDGRPFKTRSGDTIKLADLLDEAEERAWSRSSDAFQQVGGKNPLRPGAETREIARIVGLGAVKYADLLPNRQSDYVFSWNKILSFQGNTAPYLQYSYVRIRSIFRKGEIDPAALQNRKSEILLAEPTELALAKKLCQFGEILPQTLDDFRPNILANYLYELASTFHSFFEACPVLKSDGDTRGSRLVLCDVTARILEKGLALLGIEVPEKM